MNTRYLWVMTTLLISTASLAQTNCLISNNVMLKFNDRLSMFSFSKDQRLKLRKKGYRVVPGNGGNMQFFMNGGQSVQVATIEDGSANPFAKAHSMARATYDLMNRRKKTLYSVRLQTSYEAPTDTHCQTSGQLLSFFNSLGEIADALITETPHCSKLISPQGH